MKKSVSVQYGIKPGFFFSSGGWGAVVLSISCFGTENLYLI